jgi:hypothetical protein
MVLIGILIGAVGLFLIPVLLRFLFRDKEFLVIILSVIVASGFLFCSRVILTQDNIGVGIFLVYFGAIILNLFTSGYLHERKDGGRDNRYSAENNPFFEGFFSGTMLPAIIAIVINILHQSIID